MSNLLMIYWAELEKLLLSLIFTVRTKSKELDFSCTLSFVGWRFNLALQNISYTLFLCHDMWKDKYSKDIDLYIESQERIYQDN